MPSQCGDARSDDLISEMPWKMVLLPGAHSSLDRRADAEFLFTAFPPARFLKIDLAALAFAVC